jgi:hypothetical protein
LNLFSVIFLWKSHWANIPSLLTLTRLRWSQEEGEWSVHFLVQQKNPPVADLHPRVFLHSQSFRSHRTCAELVGAEGWGPRAEGWGLRAEGWGLRAEGWGLRAEGWGLRADEGWGLTAEGWWGLVRADEGWGLIRAAGWGLRAAGWGLRAAGWGLRAEDWELRTESWVSANDELLHTTNNPAPKHNHRGWWISELGRWRLTRSG